MRRLVLLAVLIAPTPAAACPDCAAGVRKQVRAGIFGADFATNLAAVALPFGVFLGITAALHTGLPPSRRA